MLWVYFQIRPCIAKHEFFESRQAWMSPFSKQCLLEARNFYLTAAAAKSRQSCLTLCDPTDGKPTDSPIHGILQARVLEWVAIAFSNA